MNEDSKNALAASSSAAKAKDNCTVYSYGSTMPHVFFEGYAVISVPVMLFFRQHRDHEGHCQYIHGYDTVVSFGVPEEKRQDYRVELLKNQLTALSGALLVAADDPRLSQMTELGSSYAKCLVVPHVGCERFAEWVKDLALSLGLTISFVEVREHESNAGGVFFHPRKHAWLYYSMKTYTETRGLTTTFIRDGKLCGGSLRVSVLFAGKYLDDRNWVIPFGQLKSFKDALDKRYDHSFLVDEHMEKFDLEGIGQVICLDRPGVTSIALDVKRIADEWLQNYIYSVMDAAGAIKSKSNSAYIRAANLKAAEIDVAGVSIKLLNGERFSVLENQWIHAVKDF